MAEDDILEGNYSTLFLTLLGTDKSVSLEFQEALKDLEETIEWLDELPGEVVKRFAVKSTKFTQLPKTPSQKARIKRGKRKVESVSEENEIVFANVVPTKLEFNEDSSQAESKQSGRPLRGCRQRSSTQADKPPVARATRQSRKRAVKIVTDVSEPLTVVEETTISDELPNGTSALLKPLESASNQCAESPVDAKRTTPRVPPLSSSKDASKNSPSVKDRANAYETMLAKTKLNPNSMSPLRTKRVLTPNAASPSFTAATISSQAKASPSVASSRSSSARRSKTRESSRSSRRVSARKSLRRSSTKKAAPSKPLRSKLRLKKQKVIRSGDTENEAIMTEDPNKDLSTDKCVEDVKSTSDEELVDSETQEDSNVKTNAAGSSATALDESQVVVTEVFELYNGRSGAELKEMEIVHTRTPPVSVQTTGTSAAVHRCSSDQGFDDRYASSDSSESKTDLNNTFTKVQESETQGRSTRTRTKKIAASVVTSDNSVPLETQQVPSAMVESAEQGQRSTRTRTRALKTKEDDEKEPVDEDVGRSTRSRQRKAESEATKAVDSSVRDVSVVKSVPDKKDAPSEAAPCRSTRSKMRKIDTAVADGKNDVVLAGSPAVKSPTAIRLQKKRLVEERGMSPKPKRSRSCMAEEVSHLESVPMSTSSPLSRAGHDDSISVVNDSLMSPLCQQARPYQFKSVQRKPSGFLNRTPGFSNNSNVFTFLGSAPTNRNNGKLTSFLTRNTPPAKPTLKELQELKKQRLAEKEGKEKEQLRRAAEAKRMKLEQLKKQREDKVKKAAEAREIRAKEAAEELKKKKQRFDSKAAIIGQLHEERMKAEAEKQKQRLKKQQEADSRRRIEEEEHRKKLLEKEEETRRQEGLMQRKREYEEAERKRQIVEEKRRQEDERLAETEMRKNEEKMYLKKLEEAKAQEKEKAKQRERQQAQERAERERIEREKREERDRRLKEEMEKLKAMEKMRVKKVEEEAKKKQMSQAQQNELQKLITKHNQQVKAAGSSNNVPALNSTQTLSKPAGYLNTSTTSSNNYQITPAVKKMYKPSDNPNDYGLNDKESDESTDDDADPKKKIPDWASWTNIKKALIVHDANPPDLEAIFCTQCLVPLDLVEVFPKSRLRHNFNKRTSSACWSSPPVKGLRKY